jgi:hypothetical protein
MEKTAEGGEGRAKGSQLNWTVTPIKSRLRHARLTRHQHCLATIMDSYQPSQVKHVLRISSVRESCYSERQCFGAMIKLSVRVRFTEPLVCRSRTVKPEKPRSPELFRLFLIEKLRSRECAYHRGTDAQSEPSHRHN